MVRKDSVSDKYYLTEEGNEVRQKRLADDSRKRTLGEYEQDAEAQDDLCQHVNCDAEADFLVCKDCGKARFLGDG